MKQKRTIDDLRPGDRVIIRESRPPRLVFQDGTSIEAADIQFCTERESLSVAGVQITEGGYLVRIAPHSTQPGEVRLYGPASSIYFRLIDPKERKR